MRHYIIFLLFLGFSLSGMSSNPHNLNNFTKVWIDEYPFTYSENYYQPSSPSYTCHKIELVFYQELLVSYCNPYFLDIDLYVYDSDGNRLMPQKGFYPAETTCVGTQISSFRINFPPGEYYLVSESKPGLSGDINLTIKSFNPKEKYTTNLGNKLFNFTFEDIIPVKISESSSNLPRQYFWTYKFNLVEAMEIATKLSSSNGRSFNFHILNEQGNIIYNSLTNNGWSTQLSESLNLAAGTYSIGIIPDNITIDHHITVSITGNGRSLMELGIKEEPFIYNLGTNNPDSLQFLEIDSKELACSFTITSPSFVFLSFKSSGVLGRQVRMLDDNMQEVFMLSRLLGGRYIYSRQLNPGTYYVQSDGIGNNGPFMTEVKTMALIPEDINDIGSYGFSFDWKGSSPSKQTSVYGRALKESFYRFVVTDSSNVTIRMETKGMLYPSLSLLNSSGSLIGNQKVSSGTSSNNLLEYTGLISAGTYYVVTEGYGGSATLSVKGNIALPASIDLGSYDSVFSVSKTHINANFPNRYGTPMGDIFYSFTLVKPMKVEIEHCGSPNAMRSCVYLLTKEGELITSNIGDGKTGKCESNKYLASIEQKVLAPGTYYIISEGNNIQGSITTNVTGTPIEIPVIDIGEKYTQFTYSNTQNTTIGQSNFGNLMNDIHYKFTLERSMLVEISNCGSSLSATYLYLIDNSGKRWYSYAENPCDYGQQDYMKLNLPRGTYSVIVEGRIQNGEIITNISGVPNTTSDIIDVGTKITNFSYSHNLDVYNNWSESYYTFTLKRTMKVSISYGSAYVKESHFYLENANRELIKASTNTNTQNARIEKTLYPGTYYILSQVETNGSIPININGTLIEPEYIDLGVKSTSFAESHEIDTRLYINNFEGFNSNDVFYKISIASPLRMNISVEGTGIDAYFTILQYGNNEQIAPGATNIWNGELDAGQVYFIVVEGSEGENGIIKLNLSGQNIKKPLPIEPVNPSVNQNYILKKNPTETIGFKDNIDSENSMQTIQYYDGLGRPTVSALIGASPYHQDLVNKTQFDELGREYRQWMSVPMQHNDGRYVTEVEFTNQAANFYSNPNTYIETIYENSPLKKVLGQKGPGDWNNHPTQIKYQSNDAFEVLYLSLDNDNKIIKSDFYLPKRLLKTEYIDEDNKKNYEFIDNQGKVILTKQDKTFSTYYIYDDIGNLRYVLPPLISDIITNADQSLSFGEDHEDVKKYAFIYKYDEYNRMVEKKLPGCDPVYYAYDKSGALLLSQDGNQRERSQNNENICTIYAYDTFNRILYTVEALIDVSIDDFRNIWKDLVLREEFSINPNSSGTIGGYTAKWGVTSQGQLLKILAVNYYDNYKYVELLSNENKNLISFNTNKIEEGYGEQHTNTKGLLTGTRTYILDDSGECITSAYYYDYRSRIVQQHSVGFFMASEHIYNKYNFSGNITKSLREYSRWESDGVKEEINELYEHTYDHANRLIKTDYTVDNYKFTLAAYEYDELGRIISKTQHNSINKIAYQYNIRNWITKISDYKFTQNIYYNEPLPVSFGFPNTYYNGNISGMKWTYGNQDQDYIFSYDELNRLKSGASSRIYSTMPYDSENYEYDKHGNITSLNRSKGNTAIDNLKFSYTGNQINSITDYITETQNTYGVKEYADRNKTTTDFTYDKNGNMITDLDRDIVHVQYNLLNLAEVVQFRNGNQIKNRYLADGTKIESNFITVHSTVNIPIGKTLSDIATGGIDAAEDKTLYVANKEYRVDNSGVPHFSRLHHMEGYLANGKHHYYRKDYLGNNREVWQVVDNMQETIQRTQYYPSGLPWAEGIGASEQPYKFGGKEFIEMHGYDMYDFSARMYQPTIMRFNTIDPLAEKYYSITPYAYCANNPLKYIDPDGKDILIWYQNDAGNWNTWSFTGLNHGEAPNNQFVNDFLMSYDYNIENGGGDYMKEAATSTNFTINLSKTINNTKRKDMDIGKPQKQSFVLWNPRQGLETKEGYSMSPATALEHEMDHAVRYEKEYMNFLKDDKLGSDPQYDTKEERRVITGSEAKTAQANREFPSNYIRKDHNSSRFIVVPSPISNKKIKYYYP